MRYLTLGEVLELYYRTIEQSGGSSGIRDTAALESALAQPRMTFDGVDLYPTIAEKASALGFSLVTITPSSMETSAWVTLQWKHFSF